MSSATYAKYVAVPVAGPLVIQPAALEAPGRAALPMAGMTALALVDTVGLTPGQTVLIAGATGRIRSYALQLAGAEGARVSATAGARESDYLLGRAPPTSSTTLGMTSPKGSVPS
jgi:NADPH:quinone reductase